jgi:indole-3-glycerol phosphate synthase
VKTLGPFLERVVARRRSDVAAAYGSLTAADLERLACCGRVARDFSGALTDRDDVAVIAEVKKASPSAGPIAPDAEAAKQAAHYVAGGAAAVSVLTEPAFFAGSYTDLSDVADAVAVPVLAKDFIVDTAQLDLAATLGLQALVEVHDRQELLRARRAGATLVGVNSRDLMTLRVDRQVALAIVSEAAACGLTVVAESGVCGRAQVEEAAAAGADAVLVGETLMRAPRPEEVLEGLTGVRARLE